MKHKIQQFCVGYESYFHKATCSNTELLKLMVSQLNKFSLLDSSIFWIYMFLYQSILFLSVWYILKNG